MLCYQSWCLFVLIIRASAVVGIFKQEICSGTLGIIEYSRMFYIIQGDDNRFDLDEEEEEEGEKGGSDVLEGSTSEKT